MVERIGTTLGKPLNLCGTTVTVAASIGIVLRTREYASAEDILRDADIAMIENIKEQISTVKQSGESKKEKEAKLVNLRDELARAQREYQKAVLDGAAGIPRVQGTRAEGMGSSLT